MKRNLIIFITLFLVYIGVHAHQIDEYQALRYAYEHIGQTKHHHAPAHDKQPILTTAHIALDNDGNNTLYIFNRNDAGYIIVAGDDNADNVILGYSDEGCFDIATAPQALCAWIEMYAQEIAFARKTGAQDSTTTYRSQFDKDVAPLVTARWGQDAPYNALCPIYDGKSRSATGCVATAMAQIMYHHQWPINGVGKKEVYTNTTKEVIDYANTTYAWDKMLPIYSSLSSEEACNAVATLMYHAGVSVDMMYGDVSGAQSSATAQALATYWNYDKGVIHRDRQYYSIAEWERMIMDEIDNNRPILYHGQSPEGGHAFVLDGYNSNGYVHINWGWNGMSNGYFLLHALSPEKQGTGGFAGGYNTGQGAVFGIQPNKGNKCAIEITAQKVAITSGISYPTGSSIPSIVTGLANAGWNSATFAIGYMLYDMHDNHVETIKSSNLTISGNNTVGTRNVIFSIPDTLQEGTYKMYLAHTDAQGLWKHVAISMNEQSYHIITINCGNVTIEANDQGRLWATEVVCNEDRIYSNGYTTFNVTMSNTTSTEYYGSIFLSIYEKSGRFEQRRSSPIAISIPAGMNVEVTIPLKVSLNKGTYCLYITNDQKEKLSEAYAIDIEEALLYAELKASNFTLTSTAKDCLEVSYKITNNGEEYKGALRAWVLFDNLQATSSYDNTQDVIIKKGETIDCRQTWSFDDGIVGEKYICSLWYYDSRKGTMTQFNCDNIPFTLTEPTALHDLEASAMRIYPNPASHYITIENQEKIESISIYNAQGTRLIDCTNSTIYVGNLPQGVYYVVIKTGNQYRTEKLLIK